jgi:hypothetical protein
MKSNIIIPKKIKVGFNPRQDTYTGMLGYVIYHDGKIWRKEPSWLGWIYNYIEPEEYERQRKEQYDARIKQQTEAYNGYQALSNPPSYYKEYIDMGLDKYLKRYVGSYKEFQPNLGRVSFDKGIVPVEYPNEPLEGFVLNRKAGGYSSGWNHRQTYCRVYDPRGFEFEITIPNLLYILENANSSVGKGLEGKFIYGWEGKDLVLVPENAPEYKEMIKFTELQDKKVSKKELIPGGIYLTSDNRKVVYLESAHSYGYNNLRSESKVLWFMSKYVYDNGETHNYIQINPIGTIKEYTGEIDDNYADYMEQLYKDTNHTPKKIGEVTYEPITAKQIIDGCSQYYYGSAEFYICENGKYKKRYVIRNHRQNGEYAISLKRRIKGYDGLEFLLPQKLLEKTPMFKQKITQKEVVNEYTI